MPLNMLYTINNSAKRSLAGQVTMFDLQLEEEKLDNIKYNFVEMPEYNDKELLSMEKEMLGCFY